MPDSGYGFVRAILDGQSEYFLIQILILGERVIYNVLNISVFTRAEDLACEILIRIK